MNGRKCVRSYRYEQVYEVLDGTNTVTFTVTGKRSELEKLDDNRFLCGGRYETV